MSTHTFTYFHAGSLFNLKELAGNALLATTISALSEGRYQPILPQDLEGDKSRPSSLRDLDLLALLRADVALFNFDGPDLDSGTVAEFMVAKFADIPAVILRTDFRRGGDQDADAWNLMLSGYPRTKQVIVDAMALYHDQKKETPAPWNAIEKANHATARQIVAAFEEVRQLPSVLSPDLREAIYRWLPLFPRLGDVSEGSHQVQEYLKAKIDKGLL